MATKFGRGVTKPALTDDHMAGYTIDAIGESGTTHSQMIVVWNNKTLRDDILNFLASSGKNYRVGDV